MTGIKKFHWLTSSTAYQMAQAWRAQRQAMVKQFLDQGSTFSTSFFGAQNDFTTGMATQAAQISLQRTQVQASAASQAVSGAVNSASSTANSLNVLT